LLVASEEERRAPVRAVGRHQSDGALRVAEGDQVLTEQAHLLGLTVGFGQLPGGKGRQPVLAQQVAHGGATPGTAQKLVVLGGKHSSASLEWVISTPSIPVKGEAGLRSPPGFGVRRGELLALGEPR